MNLAPPSYDEAIAPSSTNCYLSTRQLAAAPTNQEQQRQQEQTTLTYSLDLALHFSHSSSPPFPSPPNVWLAHDINHEDWNAFLAQLASEEKEIPRGRGNNDSNNDAGNDAGQQEIRARREKVVREWNERFFAPRGCRIDVKMTQGTNNASVSNPNPKPDNVVDVEGGKANGKQKFEGLGFRVGNSFVGLALPPNSNGAGIRVGGVLLGVAKGKQDKNENEERRVRA